MSDPSVLRKLTAIFYADVAGYSRLTGVDEEGTHRKVMEYLDFTTETITSTGGAVLRYAGDAVLAEFSSVSAAINASIAIQIQLGRQNNDLPEDQKVQIRIGVNLGEVMEDRGEIFGEGVNLAARLESTAKPGGLCISSAVFEQIADMVEIDFTDGGLETFKNIARPVHIYRWHPGADDADDSASATLPPPSEITGKKRPEKPSIAVLPFANMSNDPEQDYFSDGITEDIITDLSKVSGLFIIARNTAFTYKGKNVDLAKVSEDLGVRYILEGSVRKIGNRVRITAQLIDGLSNGHIWAERYDRDLEDIFGVQDEVTQVIVTALRVHVSDAEHQRMVRKDTDNLEAYDLVLRGRDLFLNFTRESNEQAEKCFRQAIEFDERYAAAHAELARVFVQRRNHGWSDTPSQTLDQAYRSVCRATELDETLAQAHIVKGFVHLWRHEHNRAFDELNYGLSLDPNHADGHMWKAIVAGFAGRPEEGVREVQHAMRLNPGSPFWYLFALGNASFAMGSYADCVAACDQAVQKNPNFIFAHMLLASGQGHLGELAGAKHALAECVRLNPGFSLEWAQDLIPFKETVMIERFVSGLKKAGV
jgi:adenylate cyclase